MSALALLKLVPALLRRVPWQAWALLILVAGGWWYGHARYAAGQASAQVLWDADRAAMQSAADRAIGEALAREAAALENNARVRADATTKLRAIAADRDSVASLLQQARDQIRASASSAATDRRGLDVAARIASGAAEVDRRLVEYDAACRRDAVRLGALQQQLRPQL